MSGDDPASLFPYQFFMEKVHRIRSSGDPGDDPLFPLSFQGGRRPRSSVPYPHANILEHSVDHGNMYPSPLPSGPRGQENLPVREDNNAQKGQHVANVGYYFIQPLLL